MLYNITNGEDSHIYPLEGILKFTQCIILKIAGNKLRHYTRKAC